MAKLGEMWKNLPSEEKAQWNEKAEEDKKRYETEKAAYVPTPSDEEAEEKDAEKKGKKEKKEKKAGPKAAKSAYIIYTTEMRPKVKEEHPEYSPPEMMSKLGEMWKALSDSEKEKYIKAGKTL
jgi:hypothetical protein